MQLVSLVFDCCLSMQALRHHVGVYMQVVNFMGKVYDNRLDKKGRMSFSSPVDGEHRVCFRCVCVCATVCVVCVCVLV